MSSRRLHEEKWRDCLEDPRYCPGQRLHIEPRWYFGGLAGAMAVLFTHPVDLIKVNLQSEMGQRMGLIKTIAEIHGRSGFFRGFYQGISASVLRQLTRTLSYIGLYEVMKQYMTPKNPELLLYSSVLMAALSGTAGGIMGSPADIIAIRMQHEATLPPKERTYRNVVHGLWVLGRKFGIRYLFSGGALEPTLLRTALLSVGQLSVYDAAKRAILKDFNWSDDLRTHLMSSCIAGMTTTTLIHPLDVLKTKQLLDKEGKYKSNWHCFMYTLRHEGPAGVYGGFIPALLRIGPHTVLLFLFMEQLRINFGKRHFINTDSTFEPPPFEPLVCREKGSDPPCFKRRPRY